MSDLKRLWFKIAIVFFFLTSIAGLFLRLLPFLDNFNNKYHYGILQSHSHTGFLGWVFIALYAFLIDTFGKKDLIYKKKTVRILIILTVLLLGIYISFPFNGYGFFSITFLSLFLLFSYYTLVYFYKNIDSEYKNTLIKKFILAGIIFYFISSIGPWALAPIIAAGYKKSNLYYDTIFLYLHFLYNGFITFSIIALFFNKFKEEINNKFSRKRYFHYSFITLTIGTILSYSESLLWHNPPFYVHLIAITSSFLILISVFYLYKSIKGLKIDYYKTVNYLIGIAIFLFILKIILQTFQAFPFFSGISYLFKGLFIIGYIHLVTLGFISLFLLFFALKSRIIAPNYFFKKGIYLYLTGFVLTETVLFLQGLFLLNSIFVLSSIFNLLMVVFSLFLFAGIFFILLGAFRKI